MQDQEVVLLRNSERASYRRCRQRWYWSYVQRLSTPREGGALAFGSLVHAALEHYYIPGRKRGVHPAETFEKLYIADAKQISQWDDEDNKWDALELGISMLNGYVEEYGPEDWMEIIQPEMPLAIDVFDRQGNYLVTWIGKSDALFWDLRPRRKTLGMLEHKTAKTIEDEVRVNSGYGEQGLSYWWACDLHFHHTGDLKDDQHINYVLFNWLRKGMPDLRPVNEDGHHLNLPRKDVLKAKAGELGMAVAGSTVEAYMTALEGKGINPWLLGEVSKKQPRPLYRRFPLEFGITELESINKRIRAEAWEMAQVKANKLPIYKNPTKDCSWDCQFAVPCQIHEMGGDYESVFELEYTTWNPYDYVELEEEKR